MVLGLVVTAAGTFMLHGAGGIIAVEREGRVSASVTRMWLQSHKCGFTHTNVVAADAAAFQLLLPCSSRHTMALDVGDFWGQGVAASSTSSSRGAGVLGIREGGSSLPHGPEHCFQGLLCLIVFFLSLSRACRSSRHGTYGIVVSNVLRVAVRQ